MGAVLSLLLAICLGRSWLLERLCVRNCRAAFSEKNLAHIVVGPDDLPVRFSQQVDAFRADQAAGATHQCFRRFPSTLQASVVRQIEERLFAII